MDDRTNDERIAHIAQSTGFSGGAVRALLDAMARGGGSMAQFDHPELGGAGQWMRGGMLMAGDLSDHALKARIARLADALEPLAVASAAGSMPRGSFQGQWQGDGGSGSSSSSTGGSSLRGGRWWPAELGEPDSSGAQNDTRYAYFAAAKRLVLEERGHVAVYDTGDHRIGGFGQQQGGTGSMTMASQHGPVALSALRRVDARPEPRAPEATASAAAPPHEARPAGDHFDAIERLAALHAKGVLTDAEYAAKKAELLGRI